jgi:hypothetical protein
MLSVHYGHMKEDSPRGYEPPAWRVTWVQGRGRFAFRVPFARKTDAERALAALKAAGIDTREKILEVGLEACKRIMCESLAW